MKNWEKTATQRAGYTLPNRLSLSESSTMGSTSAYIREVEQAHPHMRTHTKSSLQNATINTQRATARQTVIYRASILTSATAADYLTVIFLWTSRQRKRSHQSSLQLLKTARSCVGLNHKHPFTLSKPTEWFIAQRKICRAFHAKLSSWRCPWLSWLNS